MNLLTNIPPTAPDEHLETLLRSPNVRIERIVSQGHASPPDFWYDQDEDEWVLVVQGRARIALEGEPGEVELQAGDTLNIPAHRRHRVTWTSPDGPTIWLAVFYRS